MCGGGVGKANRAARKAQAKADTEAAQAGDEDLIAQRRRRRFGGLVNTGGSLLGKYTPVGTMSSLGSYGGGSGRVSAGGSGNPSGASVK